MTDGPARVAFDNLGAEEREPSPRAAAGSPLERLRAAWLALVDDPPWPWLARTEGLVPWLSTESAARAARVRGLPYAGAAPAVTAKVHDKAWAQAVAARHDLDPELTGLVAAVPGCASVDVIDAVVAGWPPWARASFTLKPAWGTSGRGRIRGKDAHLDVPAGWRAPAARGPSGIAAVLEPWLARVTDLSSLWHIDAEGVPHLLGTTRQVVRASGVYLGCDVVGPAGVAGDVDGEGDDGRRPRAGTQWDEVAVARARVLVTAAAAEGYRGPCGVDAFSWRDDAGGEHLRGVVELNARFTAGHVALGLALRRRLPAGARGSFRLDATSGGANEDGLFRVLGVD